MSIVKILYNTLVLFACGAIQLIGVLIDGAIKLFTEINRLLEVLHGKLLEQLEKKRIRKRVIDVSL